MHRNQRMLERSTMCFLCLVVLGFLGISVSSNSTFTYILEEENHAVAGRVTTDAQRGSKVTAILETQEDGVAEGHYLRLVKTLAISETTPHVTQMPSTSRLTSQNNPSKSSQAQPDLTGLPSSLAQSTLTPGPVTSDAADKHIPHEILTNNSVIPDSIETSIVEEDGIVYKVMGTSLFFIDEQDYIVVANSSTFHSLKDVEFFVYLSNENDDLLSTPVAFIIYINQPSDPPENYSYPAVPAIFAGVLVLFIVFLALCIPFLTRAKRRKSQGKPIFRIGSHPSMAILDSAPVLPRVDTTEPNWYGNNTFPNYEEKDEKEKADFASGIKKLSQKDQKPPILQLHKKVKTPTTPEPPAITQDEMKTALKDNEILVKE